jgi:hypothetical protein
MASGLQRRKAVLCHEVGLRTVHATAYQAGEVEELLVAAQAWLQCCKVVGCQALAVGFPAGTTCIFMVCGAPN